MANIVDQVSLGAIVQVRDRLLDRHRLARHMRDAMARVAGRHVGPIGEVHTLRGVREPCVTRGAASRVAVLHPCVEMLGMLEHDRLRK